MRSTTCAKQLASYLPPASNCPIPVAPPPVADHIGSAPYSSGYNYNEGADMIEPWLADLITLVLIAGGLVCIALTAGQESRERYCVACKRVTPWHPTHGCTVCRTLDQCF